MRIEYADVSLLGARDDNQDRVATVVTEHAALLVVLDGMGGHADGALAAEAAQRVLVEAFRHASQPLFDPLGFLHLTLGRAHDAVVRLGTKLPLEQRPRATCAVCVVQGASAYWGHIGDSRIYLLRGGRIGARTRDHSHVEFLLREGVISEEQLQGHPMRNFVESCVGGDAMLPEMTIGPRLALERGDVLFACTDGLWSGLQDAELAGAFPADAPLNAQLQALADRAVSASGALSDNTTAAALRWLGS